MDAFCLPAKQNRTNRVDWVRLVRLSLVIELTEKFQLDYQTNRTTIRPIELDWVRLIFGSVSFDRLRWDDSQFQIPNFKFQFSLGHPPFFAFSVECVSWYWVSRSRSRLLLVGRMEKEKKTKKKNHKKSRNRRPRCPRTTLKVNIHIFGLTKRTIHCKKCSCLFFSMLLLCSLFRLQ